MASAPALLPAPTGAFTRSGALPVDSPVPAVLEPAVLKAGGRQSDASERGALESAGLESVAPGPDALRSASLGSGVPEAPVRRGRLRARLAGLARMAGGGGILALLLWRLGTGPFLGGLRAIDGWALALACGIGLLTTVSCAWRWRLVARGLGVRLPLGTAVAAYYRSQFYNTVLPGGVLGDVHRAVWHGRDVGDVGRAVRAVVLERFAGQVVQGAIAIVVLFALPSPVRPYMPVVAAVAAGVVVVAGIGAVLVAGGARARLARGRLRLRSGGAGGARARLARGRLRLRSGGAGGARARLARGRLRLRSGVDKFFAGGGPSRGAAVRARAVRTAAAELRGALVARRNWLGITVASMVTVAGHVATFVVAALLAASRTPGTTAPVTRLVPLALLALLAMGLPLNLGGWGPREGVAAWAFGAAGLSATLGVSAAVVYGVLVFTTCLPGAAVPVLGWIGRIRRARRADRGAAPGEAASARAVGTPPESTAPADTAPASREITAGEPRGRAGRGEAPGNGEKIRES